MDARDGIHQPYVELVGVVVSKLDNASALKQAGVKPLDVIQFWEEPSGPSGLLGHARGPVESIFDWRWLEGNHGVSGGLVLLGYRGTKPVRFVIEGEHFGTEVRPVMPRQVDEEYLKGKALVEAGEVQKGTRLWFEMATSSPGIDRQDVSCWLMLQAADELVKADHFAEALAYYDTAMGFADRPAAEVVVWDALGDMYMQQGELERALKAYQSALGIRESAWGENLGLASNRSRIADTYWLLGEYDHADAFDRAAVATRESQASNLNLARDLERLGAEAYSRNALDSAEDYYSKALVLLEASQPTSLGVVRALDSLGHIYLRRQLYKPAEDFFTRALVVQELLGEEGYGTAPLLNDLGLVAFATGRTGPAGDYFQQAVAVYETQGTSPYGWAESLEGLGHVSLMDNRTLEARTYFERALEIVETLAPKGSLHCHLLIDLGDVAFRRDELLLARAVYSRALEICRTATVTGLDLARVFEALGLIALSQGELDVAVADFEQAQSVLEFRGIENASLARVLSFLGDVAARRCESDAAADYYLKSLGIYEGEALAGPDVARVLTDLGLTAYRDRELETAKYFMNRAVAIIEAEAPDSLAFAGALRLLGEIAFARRRMRTANEYFERALGITEKHVASGSRVLMPILDRLSTIAWRRVQRPAAIEYGKRALEIQESLSPNSLQVADRLDNLGSMALDFGDPEMAEMHLSRALEIKTREEPGSLAVASTLNALGGVAWVQGDVDSAEERWEDTLAILDSKPAEVSFAARVIRHLGLVTNVRGDFDRSEAHFQRALKLERSVNPDGLGVASCLIQLGKLASLRGELELARHYYLESLDIRARRFGEAYHLATDLMAASGIAAQLGRLKEAKEHADRAVAIYEKRVADPMEIADGIDEVGRLAQARGDLELAEDYYTRALLIRETEFPDGSQVAMSLSQLGELARLNGDLEGSLEYFGRALEIHQRVKPGSLSVAQIYDAMARVSRTLGEPTEAIQYLERALAIRNEIMPFQLKRALNFYNLGGLHQELGNLPQAADFHLKAIDVIEAQIGRLGGSYQARGNFLAQSGEVYRDTADSLLRAGRKSDALHALERFKGKVFLTMLAERDLVSSEDAEEEVTRTRRAIASRYDRVQRKLATLDAGRDQKEIEELKSRLKILQAKQETYIDELRRTSPKLASLQYPAPLQVSDILEALDPGTVLLFFNVRAGGTNLFCIDVKGHLWVKELDIGKEDLRLAVEGIRALAFRVDGDQRLGTDPQLITKAKGLYEALLAPVSGVIEESRRVLIVADGPLHFLSWGSLIRDSHGAAEDSGRSWQYLAEWKPIHTALSVTVYAQLRKQLPPTTPLDNGTLVAFGDPAYSSAISKAPGPLGRSEFRRDVFNWQRLPHSRREVESISSLFPPGKSSVYLGQEATEEAVISTAANSHIIHFATHAFLDDEFPMNSGLALTIPRASDGDRRNGLLQAWEIFGRMRLKADLVVLSACSSALGQEQGGEGLIGLTRAFQYAGARSVLASLWTVADESTAELMVRFYQHLISGLPKDEALQAAQREFIRGPILVKGLTGRVEERDYSHPFYWAAFQIYGDWK